MKEHNETKINIRDLLDTIDSEHEYSDELEENVMNSLSKIPDYRIAIQKSKKRTRNAFISNLVCFIVYTIAIFFDDFEIEGIFNVNLYSPIYGFILCVLVLYGLYEAQKNSKYFLNKELSRK